MYSSTLLAVALTPLIVSSTPTLSPRAATTLIPSSVFSSQSSLEQYFSYNYPWGTTHNGAAKMTQANEVVSGGVLSLISDYTGASDYAYTSGTVYAKQHFTVAKGQALDFQASFIAPVAKGTWPAFWLTAVTGWPPEIDMAEWKGDGKISFNTFQTSSDVSTHDITYPSPTAWHTVKCQLKDAGNGVDVQVKFWLDGTEITTQQGNGYIGKAFYLIIDYQMEGSSGSPGPTSRKWSLLGRRLDHAHVNIKQRQSFR